MSPFLAPFVIAFDTFSNSIRQLQEGPSRAGHVDRLLISESDSMEAVGHLRVPKLEPGSNDCSPKTVLPGSPVCISPSTSCGDSASDSQDSQASSSHSDRSDSEVDYEVESEGDEEDNIVRAKKQKNSVDRPAPWKKSVDHPPPKKKSRLKTTAQRADCYSPTQRTSNPGRRVVGSRIYDSVLGRTCHWCRQKTVEPHVECSLCPIRFCGPCLLNRHGEVISMEMRKYVKWVCPKCRGGCGPGCKNCCNCGPCRKSQHLAPTGQVIQFARRVGFSNVHDYLIHLKTKEDPKTVSMRKVGRGWTSTTGALVFNSIHTDDVDVKMEDDMEHDIKHVKDEPNDMHSEEDQEQDKKREEDEPEDMQSEEDEEGSEEEDLEGDEEEKHNHFRRKTGKTWDDKVQVKTEPEDRKCSTVDKKVNRLERDEGILIDSDLRKPVVKAAPVTRVSTSVITRVTTEGHSFLEENLSGPSGVDEGTDFRGKLEFTLRKQFSMIQMREMLTIAKFRKPIMKTRHTRSRSIQVPCSTEGLSYLDHYPDLGEKIANAQHPEEKLKLLRGFFFWLQHSCMEGSFKPWVTIQNDDRSGECMEISAPDGKIICVLLGLDENEESGRVPGPSPAEWQDKKPVIHAMDKKHQHNPRPVRVKQEK